MKGWLMPMPPLMVILIDILPAAILALHFVDKWCLAQGKLLQVYILTIAGSLCTIGFNYMLWLELNQKHNSIFIFTINSSWTILMSVCGLYRIVMAKRKNKDCGCHEGKSNGRLKDC